MRMGGKQSIMHEAVIRFAQLNPGSRCFVIVPRSEGERVTTLDNGSTVEFIHPPIGGDAQGGTGVEVKWTQEAVEMTEGDFDQVVDVLRRANRNIAHRT